MKTISILNLKGGVAKTFTAVNMAYELYRRGFVILVEYLWQLVISPALVLQFFQCIKCKK